MAQSTYEEVPYVRSAYPQSHPDRLATLGRLFGLEPPALERCRVLELGCASGDNLIPMALTLPAARFVGVDLSERQIASGQATVDALAVGNIELVRADLASVDATWGMFDYIVCHGVYSWVPQGVRNHILRVCRENLAVNGIAYVSYNALPGWKGRGMIREMMLYHTDKVDGVAEKAQQARSLLHFLTRSATPDTAYAATLKAEHDRIENQDDAYLLHDHLEQDNDAVYFHQFVAHAREHELVYCSEAIFRDMMVSNFAPPVAAALERFGPDMLRVEQYMDFVRNRSFRQTLLVHKGAAIRRRLDWRALESMYVVSAATPAPENCNLDHGVSATFHGSRGAAFSSSNALVKAAMVTLWQHRPQANRFSDLLAASQSLAFDASVPPTKGDAPDDEVLGTLLLQCYAAGLVELRTWSPAFAADASSRPCASPLARHQAASGHAVTSLRHEMIPLDPHSQRLLQLLDGTRDRTALLAALAPGLLDGSLPAAPLDADRGTAPVTLTSDWLELTLSKFARAALLCA